LRTLGSPFLALLLQEQGGGMPESSAPLNYLDLIAHTTPVGKVVLILLGLMSVVSWGVILYKWFSFSKASRQSAAFLDVFRRSSKFSEVQAVCRSLGDSPLVGLFQAGYAELTAQMRHHAPADLASAAPNPTGTATRPTLKSITAVDRALMRASVIEMNKLEHWISFLATTASAAPFVGLFGTVVGIMIAFFTISQTGSTGLTSVAPGIAEALITTAMGLVTAIPAVMAYNYLSYRVKLFGAGMDDFSMEFLNICERNFT
jgi:biopolymer transport protein TolQ